MVRARGGACPRASRRLDPWDAGKKIKGRKRHALVDTDGRVLLIEPHQADVQARDGGGALLRISRRFFPLVARAFADGAYDQERVTAATSITVEIVCKLPDQVGFVVLPRRWVVERLFAWLGRIPRLAKEFEATIASAAAFRRDRRQWKLIEPLIPKARPGGSVS